MSIDSLIEKSKVIVCVGSGGVGKTTTSSAVALYAAQKGLRVLALTIDPAQRLKTTLGLKDDDYSEVYRHESGGVLYAGIINPKKVFDEFVMRSGTTSEVAQKILNNRLYVELSTTLSGSQEFTALEKLYSSVESGKYDLIVLDTPPTKHAIDFLNAPEKLNALFNEGVAKWFRGQQGDVSIFNRILNTGTAQVLKALETITGNEFMKELADFFRSIQSWQPKIEKRIHDVHQLLVDEKTQFVLVTSFDQAKLLEAEFFAREIKKGGYTLSHIIVNRSEPLWLQHIEGDNSAWGDLFATYKKYFQKKSEDLRKFTDKVGSHTDRVSVVQIPELNQDVSDIKGVELVTKYFKV